MKILGFLFTLLLVILGFAFAALNDKPVQVNYLIGTTEMSLAFLSFISLVLGMLLSITVMGLGMLKLTAKNKWLESKFKKAQEQLTQVQH